MWIDPVWIRNNLRVRITSSDENQINEIKQIFEEHKNQIHPDVFIEIKKVKRACGEEKIIKVIVPMKKLFNRASGDEINQKLKTYIVKIFDALDDNIT